MPGLLDSLPGQRSGYSDPLVNPKVLAFAIKTGLLDAPHLVGNPAAFGKVCTSMVNGACVAVDPESGKVLPEADRIERILSFGEESFSMKTCSPPVSLRNKAQSAFEVNSN